MQKTSISIIEQLREIIFSETIISDYKMNKQDFTQKRKQPFGGVLLFMFNLLRKSMTIEIDNFLQHLNSKLDPEVLKISHLVLLCKKEKK